MGYKSKMREQGFWHENESYIDSVMNTVNMLAEDTYIYILHLNQEKAWFSETAKKYFGMKDTYVQDHYKVILNRSNLIINTANGCCFPIAVSRSAVNLA